MLQSIEALASSKYCMSGGEGASHCKHAGTIEVLGVAVAYDCEVSCIAGYYACCNQTCNCVKYE